MDSENSLKMERMRNLLTIACTFDDILKFNSP